MISETQDKNTLERKLETIDRLSMTISSLAQDRDPDGITQAIVFCLARTTWEHFQADDAKARELGKRLNSMYLQTYRTLTKMAKEQQE